MASALCSVSFTALPTVQSAPVSNSHGVCSRAAESERKHRPSSQRQRREEDWHFSAQRRPACDSRGRIEASVASRGVEISSGSGGDRQLRRRRRLRRGGIGCGEGESTVVVASRRSRRSLGEPGAAELGQSHQFGGTRRRSSGGDGRGGGPAEPWVAELGQCRGEWSLGDTREWSCGTREELGRRIGRGGARVRTIGGRR
jgi:hypothetical protein